MGYVPHTDEALVFGRKAEKLQELSWGQTGEEHVHSRASGAPSQETLLSNIHCGRRSNFSNHRKQNTLEYKEHFFTAQIILLNPFRRTNIETKWIHL